MQTFVVAAAQHKTARKLVNNDNLAVSDNVVNVAVHNSVCADCLIYVVQKCKIVGIHKVFNLEKRFCFLDTRACKCRSSCLFVNDIVALDVLAALFIVKLFNLGFYKALCKNVGSNVKVGRFVALTRYNKRSSCLVDKNGVNLVNDGKVKGSLNLLVLVNDHIITKIVKTKLVVCTVGYVGVVSLSALVVIQTVNNKSNRKTHKTEDFTHPFRVASCKIVVNRNNVNAMSRQRVKISREGCNQGFTFTCSHFADSSLMKNYTADNLNGIVLHSENSEGGLAACRKGFGQNVVGGFACGKSVF